MMPIALHGAEQAPERPVSPECRRSIYVPKAPPDIKLERDSAIAKRDRLVGQLSLLYKQIKQEVSNYNHQCNLGEINLGVMEALVHRGFELIARFEGLYGQAACDTYMAPLMSRHQLPAKKVVIGKIKARFEEVRGRLNAQTTPAAAASSDAAEEPSLKKYKIN